MNTKEYLYSWHLSLRADRPVEGCGMRPHAYMYGKKLDEREDKMLPPHSKKNERATTAARILLSMVPQSFA